MRITWIFALLFAMTVFSAVNAEASEGKKVICKLETKDIGTIYGRGPSSDMAMEDAMTQCFERRQKLHELKYGRASDFETGEIHIEVCVNVKCS